MAAETVAQPVPAEREPGFYWVRWIREWIVAQWWDGCWFLPGIVLSSNDDCLAEIGERVERVTADERVIQSIVDAIEPPAEFCRWPQPQPITAAQRTGERFLVLYDPRLPCVHSLRGWIVARWETDDWIAGLSDVEDMVWLDPLGLVHYLPLPPDMKP